MIFALQQLFAKFYHFCLNFSIFLPIYWAKNFEMFSRLKLITFDAKDTIICMKKSAGRLYGEVASLYGVSIQESDIKRMESSFGSCFNHVNSLYPNYGNGSQTNQPVSSGVTSQPGQITLLKWWSMVIECVFKSADVKVQPDVLNQICIHSFKSFASSECWSVKGNALQDLTEIRTIKPQLKMAVVSNGDERLRPLLTHLGLEHLFDFIIDSHTYKCEKPCKEIFDTALAEAGLNDPSLALHVGDDILTDYNGARSAGWNALLLLHEEKIQQFQGIASDQIITRIQQLIQK